MTLLTRQLYIIDTRGGGQIDIVGDPDQAAVTIVLRHGHPSATLNIEQARSLQLALSQAIAEANMFNDGEDWKNWRCASPPPS